MFTEKFASILIQNTTPKKDTLTHCNIMDISRVSFAAQKTSKYTGFV